ncbi:MAG TPA: hypothetical protein VFX92_01645, partial [Candidatus Krumholzibacteria bacterium]|nr:hypothetical protein [Candidatus Krumholzibacteria bacterium]
MKSHMPEENPAFPTIPLAFERITPAAMEQRSREFLVAMRTRRSVRHFSPEPVPRRALLDCIEAA